MAKEFLISDLPQLGELTGVFDKVKSKLETIKTLSEETNELLKSVGAKEIKFSVDLDCDHLYTTKSNGSHNSGDMSAICSKCGYEPSL